MTYDLDQVARQRMKDMKRDLVCALKGDPEDPDVTLRIGWNHSQWFLWPIIVVRVVATTWGVNCLFLKFYAGLWFRR